jgi:hypothetical protein
MAHPARRVVLSLIGVAGFITIGCASSTEPLHIGVPAGWGIVGTNSASYTLGVDHGTVHGGSAALTIAGTDTSRARFSGVGQFLRADTYRGKRVRLRAWVQQQSIVGTDIGLWMRIDGPGVTQGFDNFSTRPLLGTATWHRVEIILDVPDDAIGIAFGALMSGRGELFVDDMTFEIIPAEGPTTNLLAGFAAGTDSAVALTNYRARGDTPINLDFEMR